MPPSWRACCGAATGPRVGLSSASWLTRALLGRETGPGAAVDLGLVDPLAEGLGADARLAGAAGDDTLALDPFEHRRTARSSSSGG